MLLLMGCSLPPQKVPSPTVETCAVSGKPGRDPGRDVCRFLAKMYSISLTELKELLVQHHPPLKKNAALYKLLSLGYRDNPERLRLGKLDASEIRDFLLHHEDEIMSNLDLTDIPPEKVEEQVEDLGWRYREARDCYQLLSQPPEIFEQTVQRILLQDIKNPSIKPHWRYWFHLLMCRVFYILIDRIEATGDYKSLPALVEMLKDVEEKWNSPDWLPDMSKLNKEMYIRFNDTSMSYYRDWLSWTIYRFEHLYYRKVEGLSDEQIIDLYIKEVWKDGKIKRQSRKESIRRILQEASQWDYSGKRTDRKVLECYARWLNDLSTSYPELVKELFQLAPGVETLYGYQKYAIAKDEHGRYIVKEICR